MEGGGEIAGLGLLPIQTVLKKEKTTVPVTAQLISSRLFGLSCATAGTTGYEIHLGETEYQPGATALFRLLRRNQAEEVLDGAENATGLCFGTYVHGVFDSDEFRHSFLTNVRAILNLSPPAKMISRTKTRDDALNRLADTVERSVDMEEVSRWLEL
jgi:adenosylcobyric acid synthase